MPSIIASYVSPISQNIVISFKRAVQGASAVLCYGAIEAPLAQPRALMGGHFISGLIGVCITKLFRLLHNETRFDELRWLAGSLSTATAIVAMQITETTHPPAGATALLAAVNDEITDLGWQVLNLIAVGRILIQCRYYLPIILLSSSLVLVSALITNNIQRRYPVYWFAPVVPAKLVPPPETPESASTNREAPKVEASNTV